MPAQHLAAFFCASLPLKTKNDKIILGVKTLNSSGCFYRKLFDLLGVEKQNHILERFNGKELAEFESERFSAQLESEVIKVLKSKEGKPSQTDIGAIYFSDAIKTPLNEIYQCIDIENNQSKLWDKKEDQIYSVHNDVLASRLEERLGDALCAWLANNRIDCSFGYYPTKDERLVKIPGSAIPKLNLYRKPAWKIGWKPSFEAGEPTMFLDLAKFFIGGDQKEKCLKAFLAWYRDCLFSRATPILILRGVPGVGKNILMQETLMALLGFDNWASAESNFLNSAFHAVLTRSQLFLLDERPLDQKMKELLKQYYNGVGMFQRKYVETGTPENIFASLVLTNNYKRNVKLEANDRKFFVPDLNTAMLMDYWGQEKIDAYLESLKDPEELRKIASWLYFNFDDGESKNFPKTKSFFDLCESGTPEWFRTLRTLAQRNKTVTSKMLTKELGTRKRIGFFTVQDEMENDAIMNKRSIGDLVDEGAGGWTLTSKIFKDSEVMNQKGG